MKTPLLENIMNQPDALRAVAAYQAGAGARALARAAVLLQAKKRIVLSGMGASLFACLSFRYALASLGIQAEVIEAAELVHFLSQTIDRETAVVVVSRSGESVEVVQTLSLLRERGATVIGIVNVEDSTLAREADQAIFLNSAADQMVAIQTYTATLLVLGLLSGVIAGASDEAQVELLLGMLVDLVPAWIADGEQWGAFLGAATPLYLLGRGPALGSVQEGVLLMHETAKAPAIGMSVAQFRHGPVEVMSSGFRAIVIGTNEGTTELDLRFAQDVAGMGGAIRWIGPGNEQRALCSWPSDWPPRFHSIAEVIPLQLAAYRLAEIRGVTPGAFRWAPQVTSTEAGFATPVAH